MDDALNEKARAMALKGAAILDGCTATGNWPALMSGVDFSSDTGTPVYLISPNSRIDEALGTLAITHQQAHDALLVRRGDIPADVANKVWRVIAGEYQLEGSRT